MMGFRVATLWFALALAAPVHLAAQGPEVRGFLRDSASGEPIAGAVVLVLDSRGQVVNRTISGARGQYRVLRPASAVQVRALRLGFRPLSIALPAALAESTVIDVTLATVARTLDAMVVTAARGCPARADRAEAFGLLDQARAGLLAAVVARERQPAAMRVLRFERLLDLDGVAIERQEVRIDSSLRATTSFNAVQSAIDFVDRGFRVGREGQFTYYGPDADVLLDERFQRGYCFSLAEARPDRAAQRGLRFAPAGRRRGRVDIEGTLWIDTAQRALRDIEFLYLGLDRLAASFAAGGRIGFRALPNGITFIDQWSLRLVGAADTMVTDAGASSQEYAIREIGGEVAHARWSDSTTFVSTLGTAHLTAVTTDGEPAAFARLHFTGTDYRALTDSMGRASIPFMLPGPYRLVVDDPRLDAIDLEIPIARPVTVQRAASALLRVIVPTAEQFVAPLCGRDSLLRTDAWLLARVVGSEGEPLGGASYRISDMHNGAWRVISERGVTPSTGLVAFCRIVTRGSDIEVAVWRRGQDVIRMRRALDRQLTVMRVVMPTVTVASRPGSDPGKDAAPIVVSGVVMDSVRRVPVANARVTFLGTPFEAATDSSGRFVIGGIARGAHRIEVSSPWHDSIGAVGRTAVTIRDTASLTLSMPAIGDLMQAACGTSASSGTTGAIVGRVAMRDRSTVPGGTRVVAEWSTALTDRRLANAVVESGGTFRVCGVPTNTAVRVRAESDRAAASVTGAMREIRVADDRRFARADLVLDSAIVTLPVFVGAVVTDSLGLPIANAEVTLTDVGRTTRTDAKGAFRFDDVPVGTHLVSVRQVGFAPLLTTIDFAAGGVVEQRVPLSRATSLIAIDVNADGVPADFDQRRKLGAGTFLARADLERFRGRRLGEVVSQVTGFGQAVGGGTHSYIVGKRAPVRVPPRSTAPGAIGCGQGGRSPPCTFTVEGLRDQGFYCPTQAEQRLGILSCACFARVYVDNQLMNSGHPTEPFDISTLAVDEIAGLEFFPTAASTPSRYSALNATCGVMLVWTRR